MHAWFEQMNYNIIVFYPMYMCLQHSYVFNWLAVVMKLFWDQVNRTIIKCVHHCIMFDTDFHMGLVYKFSIMQELKCIENRSQQHSNLKSKDNSDLFIHYNLFEWRGPTSNAWRANFGNGLRTTGINNVPALPRISLFCLTWTILLLVQYTSCSYI